MTAYPGCAGLARTPFVLTEHISSENRRYMILASERASETLIGLNNGNRRYIYVYI